VLARALREIEDAPTVMQSGRRHIPSKHRRSARLVVAQSRTRSGKSNGQTAKRKGIAPRRPLS
jgi:hypothetical protein